MTNRGTADRAGYVMYDIDVQIFLQNTLTFPLASKDWCTIGRSLVDHQISQVGSFTGQLNASRNSLEFAVVP